MCYIHIVDSVVSKRNIVVYILNQVHSNCVFCIINCISVE